jgi:DNA repair exonuclease SbcCD ATPase subunit
MKRVNFKRVVAKNFLSIGEEPVEIELNQGLHIITGNNKDKPERRNAVGKSTVAESIYFAIFGETIREIKKDLICNNITGGKAYVELDFDIENTHETKQYKIIRTLSPTKVSLYEDGVDKTHDTVNNTTTYICNLISASPAVFKNCVIMTVNAAVPFMAKNKTEKRKFIEDVFGFEIFSNMISYVRSEYNDVKRQYELKSVSLNEVESHYNGYISQRDIIIKNREEKKNLYITRKEDNKKEIEEVVKDIRSINIINTDELDHKISTLEKDLEECDVNISNVTSEIATNKQKISTLKSSYGSVGTDKDVCPICLREIKDHDQDTIENEKIKIKTEIESLAVDTKLLINDLNEINNNKKEIKDNIASLRNDINLASVRIVERKNKILRLKQLKEWLNNLEEDIKDVSSTDTEVDNNILSTKERLELIRKEVSDLQLKLSELDIVKYIVSEEGVKSYIVNKLLELLNSRLFFYLNKLDSNVVCMFNEYFEEEILNEKNKVCSYFNFSGAERKAIDLACLFTFSDLRRMQGGVQYNIAIYDELFDSSFDERGIELVTAILKERVDELNECNIVISHRKESIKAATGDVIFLEKENGITRRIQYEDV